MLETYAAEFTAVVKHLLKDPQHRRKGDFLLADKRTIVGMLEKNAYDTAANKLKVWKGLHWLDTDDNRLTKRIVDKDTGKQMPCLKISLNVYKNMQSLIMQK